MATPHKDTEEQLETGADAIVLEREAVPLPKDEVHLWFVADRKIEDPLLLHTYRQWLSEAENSRCQRYYFEKDRHQSLVTRALVRYVLSRYVKSIDEKEWGFKKNEYGRPAIVWDPSHSISLHFNLSHTAGMIVLAVCAENEIGVDIENLTRQSSTIDIAERYFSQVETSDLLKLPKEKQQERFFDLWTLKESYIKARGMGLSIPLDSFTFRFPILNTIAFQVEENSDDHADGWQFWQGQFGLDYKIAVAHRNGKSVVEKTIQAITIVPGVDDQEIELTCISETLHDPAPGEVTMQKRSATGI